MAVIIPQTFQIVTGFFRSSRETEMTTILFVALATE